MIRLRCPTCGDAHDLSEGQVGYDLPDEYFALGAEERRTRGHANADLCELDGRCFIRGAVLLPILGERHPFGWGVWAEVSRAAFDRYVVLYANANQASEPAFPGQLANALPGYRTTLGLGLSIQLVSDTVRPHFTVTSGGHQLAREQRAGIPLERVLEIMSPFLHAAIDDGAS